MNIWLKRLPIILCSGFFFPVSCTLGTAVSLPIIQHMDARDITKGRTPHYDFSVLAIAQDNNNEIVRLRLDNLQSYRDTHPDTSFLMTDNTGVIELNEYTSISYTVIEQSGSKQIIEATLTDDDGHVLSRYEVRGNEIVPLYSDGYFKSYAFIALRNGIVLAFILYFAGKLLGMHVKRKAPAT
ncbi:MAG: hypothetical protein HN764_15255 [Gammaproteobacteria bacterium]|jgi:hypothetical protein|nr:hypothetical protein [Gammaproteobacteria bacterium]